MDNYGTMNNSYGNIVYSGQLSEITPLQGQAVQYQYQLQGQPQPEQYFDALKQDQYQGRESIIATNVTAEAPVEQVAYQVQEPVCTDIMDQPEAVQNHDGEAVPLQENHPENHQAEGSTAEEQAVDSNGMQEERLEEVEEGEKKPEEEAKGEDDNVDGEKKNDVVDDGAVPGTSKEGVKAETKEEAEEKPKVCNKDGTPADLDICRVCKSKEDLGDIFELEESVRICDLIMKLCTNVRIAQRDHLPHKICKSCVEKVRIAYDFKTTCENTDKELRQTLKRSYNKSRRTTDFVIVNCPMSDGEENDEEPKDDDEYKVSQSEVESEPVTSDDSFAPSSKKRKTRTPKRPRRGGRRPRSEPSAPPPETTGRKRRGRQPGFSPRLAAAAKAKAAAEAAAAAAAAAAADTPRRRGRPSKESKAPGLANVVYIEAPDPSSSDSEDDKPIKPRKTQKTHDCNKCDETFTTGVELKEHLQTHKNDLFPCTKCEKTFKSKAYLTNHLQRHEQDEKKREEKLKAKEEKKKQQRLKEIQKRKEHEERLKRQKAQATSSAEKKKKPEPTPVGTGRDLFKCVAPLTSTYWSDSFSD